MARLSGKTGTVSINASVTGVTDWSIDYKGDPVDTTGMDSSGAKVFIGGLTEWSGDANGHWESGAAPNYALVGTVIAVSLVSSATVPKVTCSGNAVVTGLKITSKVDGAVDWGYTFQGTAGLTIAGTYA